MRLYRGKERNTPPKRLFPAIVCQIILIAWLASSCGKEEEKAPAREVIRPVKVLTVVARGGGGGLQFPGRVRASRRVELAFKVVGGRLIELPIAGKEGGYVKKGDLLAWIDPKDFQTDLRNAEGQLREGYQRSKLSLKISLTGQPCPRSGMSSDERSMIIKRSFLPVPARQSSSSSYCSSWVCAVV